jgi:hypothetical protein
LVKRTPFCKFWPKQLPPLCVECLFTIRCKHVTVFCFISAYGWTYILSYDYIYTCSRINSKNIWAFICFWLLIWSKSDQIKEVCYMCKCMYFCSRNRLVSWSVWLKHKIFKWFLEYDSFPKKMS